MKKSKILSFVLAVVLSLGAVGSITACKRPSDDSSGNEALDTKKTQLYVRNYQGGFVTSGFTTEKTNSRRNMPIQNSNPGKKAFRYL